VAASEEIATGDGDEWTIRLTCRACGTRVVAVWDVVIDQGASEHAVVVHCPAE
jgi:hypothetical protein